MLKEKKKLTKTLPESLEIYKTKTKNSLKIGIISINTHTADLNFACPLHSFVFSRVLSDLGYSNVIINYYPLYMPMTRDHKYPLLHALKVKDATKKKKLVSKWTKLFYQRKDRFDKFQAFIDDYYNYTENIYTGEILDTMSNAEDINCYIVATDTIWKRYTKGFDKGFLLNARAMKDCYRIAYSVSRGGGKYKKEEEAEFIEYIKDINDVSVRERSFSEYIGSISGVKAEVVLDPVFLGDKSFYQSLMVRPKRKGYVLAYLMQEANDMVLVAAKFAEENGLDLIELSDIYEDAKLTGYSRHSVHYDVGIEEWLGYINDAEYVFTNSFHGTCFSIILEKQFFLGGKRGGDKSTFLIERFGLQSRRIEKSFDEENKMIANDIDYETVNHLRDEQRKTSLDFLTRALKKAEDFEKEKKTLK